MRKVIGVAVAMVLLLASSAAAQEPAFRNLCWGDPVTALGPTATRLDPDILSRTYMGMEFWMQPDESLQLGPLAATGIYYGFFRNRLSLIMIVTTPDNAETAHHVAEARYGEAFYQGEDGTFYADEDTLCCINSTSDLVGMALYSKSLFSEYQTWVQTFGQLLSPERISRFIRVRDTMYATVDDIYRQGMVPTAALTFEYLGIALTSYQWGLESRVEFVARVETVCPGWQSDPTQFGPWLAGPLEHFRGEIIDFRFADEMLAIAYNRFKPASWPEWGYWR